MTDVELIDDKLLRAARFLHDPLADDLVEAASQLRDLRARLATAEKFKAFVHSYLDQHGVPHGDPTNRHQIEGCRIGARLDLLFAQVATAEGERDRLRKAIGDAKVQLIRYRAWEITGGDTAKTHASNALAALEAALAPAATEGEAKAT